MFEEFRNLTQEQLADLVIAVAEANNIKTDAPTFPCIMGIWPSCPCNWACIKGGILACTWS